MHRPQRKWLLGAAALCTLGLMSGAAQAKVKVVFWDKWASGSDYDSITKMVKAFNASQDQIEVDYQSPGDFLTKFVAAEAGGSPPDIIGSWNHRTGPFAYKGLIQPIEPLAKASGLDLSVLIPNFRELSRYNGQLYQVPALPSVITLMWNKQVFSQAGLDPETPPAAWADLDAYDKKITQIQADGQIQRVGFSPFFPNWWPYLWGWLDGGSLWDGDNNAVTADNPQVVAGYRYIRDLIQRHSQGSAAAFRSKWGDYMNPFIDGKLGLILMGSWVPTQIASAKDLSYGVAPIPAGPDGEPFSLLESDTWAIAAGAKHPAEAMQFLKWMYEPAQAKQFAQLRGQFSVVRSVDTPAFFSEIHSPGTEAFSNVAIGHPAHHAPNMPIWDAYSDALGKATNDIMALKADPGVRLKQVQQQIAAKWADLKSGK
ncbi:MAG TPA: ABC transporter substrate-binding protein [Limnochordia bacterium]|nr:ABC transporter substrate-binding protein [Limnochordia bacterium]